MHPFNLLAFGFFAFMGVEMLLKGDGTACLAAFAIGATILIAGAITGGGK